MDFFQRSRRNVAPLSRPHRNNSRPRPKLRELFHELGKPTTWSFQHCTFGQIGLLLLLLIFFPSSAAADLRVNVVEDFQFIPLPKKKIDTEVQD